MSGFHAQAVKAADEHFQQTQRAELRKLRAELRQAQANHRSAMRDVRAQCREIRKRVSAKIHDMRERARKKLNAIALRERIEAKAKCLKMLADARAMWTDRVQLKAAKLAAERSYQRELANIERANRQRAKAHPHASYLERRGESDDEIRQNIPAEFHALFAKVKHKIKGSKLISRSEAMMHYVHEHPDAHLEVIEHEAHRELKRLQAEERAARRQEPGHASRSVGQLARSLGKLKRPPLSEVPF